MSPLIGIAGILSSLWYVFTVKQTGFTGYFDVPSMILLGVTPPCVMLLSHSLIDYLTGIKTLFTALFSNLNKQEKETIQFITEASKIVRSDGMGALISIQKKAKYPLLRDGISLIVNDFKQDEIRHNITARINAKQSHLQLASNLFDNLAKVCPGIGMIGTLIGLISMMSDMDDPSKLGTGMALAMVTTLYGIMLGTIIYAPCGEKIALEAEKTLEIDLLVMESIINIKSKKSSVHLNNIVKTYGKQKTNNAKKSK